MRIANVFRLGIKELRSLARDPIMLTLIVYAFTFGVYARRSRSSTRTARLSRHGS
jgi:hypothetical protein